MESDFLFIRMFIDYFFIGISAQFRHEFDSANSFDIPDVPKAKFTENELRNLLMLGFNQLKKDDGKHSERIVHFFLYDYNFEKVWDKLELYLKPLFQYKGILTPDFSMYI